MTRPIVLMSANIHPVGLALLAEHFEVHHAHQHEATPAEIADALVDADAVVVRSADITGEMMRRSPRLKVVAKHGAGLDSVDVATATELGIVVANSGDANAGSVAEHAVALMLATLHQVPYVDRVTRRPDGYQLREGLVLGDLSEAAVGLVGFGNIARRTARMVRGFDTRVVAFDPMVPDEVISAAGVEPAASLEQLLEVADIVSIHTPLTPQTHHLIGADQLKLMKEGAILVNTARGGVVDETALLAALDDGSLRGAGLDVFEQEPPDTTGPLFADNRVVMSPHVAGGTELARKRAARAAATAAIDVLAGRRPEFWVNTEAAGHTRVSLADREAEEVR